VPPARKMLMVCTSLISWASGSKAPYLKMIKLAARSLDISSNEGRQKMRTKAEVEAAIRYFQMDLILLFMPSTAPLA